VNPDLKEQELLRGLAVSDKKAIETIYKENYNMVQSLVINNSSGSKRCVSGSYDRSV
jgi:hypothetical protein